MSRLNVKALARRLGLFALMGLIGRARHGHGRGQAGAADPLSARGRPRPLPARPRQRGDGTPVKAIILAAGVARRLAPLTDYTHKCVIPIGGHSLLDRMVSSLADNGVEETVIVVGHCQDQVRAAAGDCRGAMRIRYVDNPDYQKGSILSSGGRVTSDQGTTIVMDGDVLFPTGSCPVSSPRRTRARCSSTRASRTRAGWLYGVGTASSPSAKFVPQQWDVIGEGIGFFKCSPAHAPSIRLLAESIEQTGGVNEYEDALHHLLGVVEVGWVDVTGLPWTEVDFVEDLRRAEPGAPGH